MVKVKEFFCGFTLRTGTLILAWMVLVRHCLAVIFIPMLLAILFHPEYRFPSDYKTILVYLVIYESVDAITAITVSIVAIWAVHKKKAKFLNGLFWYFCYIVVLYVLCIIVRLFNPMLEEELIPGVDPFVDIGVIQKYALVDIAVYLFITAFALYFALVVKSHRDYMLTNQTRTGDFEANRPDPEAFEYVIRKY